MTHKNEYSTLAYEPLLTKIPPGSPELQKIYHLRVLCHEHSGSEFINRQLFPNGWADDLDELDTTIHWIIKEGERIAASARLCIVHHLDYAPLLHFKGLALPKQRPFAYWSRLVVHPDYRKTNCTRQLDQVRKQYLTDHHIPFAVCLAAKHREQAIRRLGFEHIGTVYDETKEWIDAFIWNQ